jgi:hypothetical protein
VTRCRSSKIAMSGWSVSNKIDHSATHAPSSCELCGTHFRRGAVVTRLLPRSTKPITLTIGGDCLSTLLLHQFGNAKEVAKRRAETTRQIEALYDGLADPGSWITWVYENATRRVSDAAVRLKHIGFVRSKAELNKLVAFHDANRKYATEAIFPRASVLREFGISVPKSITLDQWRRLRAGISDDKLSPALAKIGERFLEDAESQNIDRWTETWLGSSPLDRRLIAALGQISDWLSDDDEMTWTRWLKRHVKLPSMIFPSRAPQFVWSPGNGLGLLTEDAATDDTLVEVFLWGRNEYPRFRAGALRAATTDDRAFVIKLEREAFWND